MEISFTNLSKIYRDADRDLTVINSLTYKFESGSRVAIVGRSGVGKSTLLQILGGLDRPTAGVALLGGQDISKLSSDELAEFRGKNVGFIFQFHHLLPEFSALENVMMPLVIHGVDPAECEQRSRNLLHNVGLSDRVTHTPSQLSGGEQQRVAIARALVIEPKLVLADEPTGNLDFATGKEVQELLLSVSARIGATLIVVTHNLELARNMDSVVEMLPGGDLKICSLSNFTLCY